MPTIGVGKAFRDQDRAAQAARNYARERSKASADLPDAEGEVACARCGDPVPLTDTMVAADGDVCLACHGAEQVVHPSPWADARQTGLGTALYVVSLVLPLVLVGSNPRGSNPMLLGGWYLVTVAGMAIGAFLTLRWVRHVRDSARAPVVDEEIPVARLSRAILSGVAALAVGTITFAMGVLMFLPLGE